MTALLQTLKDDANLQLAHLAAAETAAADRVRLVQSFIDRDPAARLVQMHKSHTKSAVSLYWLAGLFVLFVGALVQCGAAECAQGLKRLLRL